MPPKTKRRCIADVLDDLEPGDFEKFIRQLLDRKEEPRVRRAMVQGKSRLQVADVLVSTFTEDDAVNKTVEFLKGAGCHEAAKELVDDVSALSAKPGSGGGDVSGGATGGGSMADGEHFVDKHRTELIQRVAYPDGILDDLFDEKVIQQEKYDEIMALPTSQRKMRAIFDCLKAGTLCKDIFYKSLEKNEPYLMKELKGN